MLTILSFILVILVVVLPHEIGHMLFAIRAGIRPLEMGIGFGPRLFSFKKNKTRYSFNMFPLGGFIRIAGMNPEEDKEFGPYPESESYMSRGPLDKALIMLGGPLMNFVFAFLVLAAIFFFLGSPAGISNEIASIAKGSEAERIGLVPGDKLVSLGGVPVTKPEAAVGLIHKNAGKRLSLGIERKGQAIKLLATPAYDQKMKIGLIGFSLKPLYKKVGLLGSLRLGAREVLSMISLVFVSLGLLITGRASMADLAGPVGIAQISGQAAHGGLVSLLGFAAFLSVNLGVLNLLPLPALDGGRVVFLLIEGIRKKPLSQEIENRIHYVGFALLLALAFVLTVNDVLRWLSPTR